MFGRLLTIAILVATAYWYWSGPYQQQRNPDAAHRLEADLEKMRQCIADTPWLQVWFAGYVSQEQLPKYYGDSKTFLFPTQNDPWGIVANEACASGTPVVTCENAGVAGELVKDGYDGYVLPLDVQSWVCVINELLDNPDDWQRLSNNALLEVEKYNFNAAANGILKACKYSIAI